MATVSGQHHDSAPPPQKGQGDGDSNKDASGYFESYNDLGVHELMLKDRPRTLAYRNFFETHRDLVKDKVVMDVGAGTGILSLFAAVAGAKKVYAVEASGMASLCKEVVEENGMEKVIEVIHGAVEDIELNTKVDVIVSEWMGFYLLHESMLDSVIVARDRFLSTGGVMAPSHATIYFAPVDMSEHFEERAEEWSNIYGFDFSPVASVLNRSDVSQPLVKVLSPETLRAEPGKLLNLDLCTVTQQDVRKFTEGLEFRITQDTRVHGFACWFDVDFCGRAPSQPQKGIDEKGDSKTISPGGVTSTTANCSSSVNLSSKPTGPTTHQPSSKTSREVVSLRTGPSDPPTHWKQTVIFLPQTIMVGAGTEIGCRVTMAQDVAGNKRHYNITVALMEDPHMELSSSEDDDGVDVVDDDDCDDDEAEEDHPVPCECGYERCKLIAALVEKYGAEHEQLGDEAELVEVQAEVAAARQLDEDIEKEGWPMDFSNTSATDDPDKI